MNNKKGIILMVLVIIIILISLVITIKLINKKENNSIVEFPTGKTINSLSIGDDLIIATEKFKVFKTDDINVYAMPYYNITLSMENPEQTELPEDHYIQFVNTSNNYWEEETDIIDMTEKKNNVQQYITAYSSKLNALDSRITARIARYSELQEVMKNDLRNPGENGIFWIGSSLNNIHVYYIEKDGSISDDNYEGNIGVRPIIIINK